MILISPDTMETTMKPSALALAIVFSEPTPHSHAYPECIDSWASYYGCSVQTVRYAISLLCIRGYADWSESDGRETLHLYSERQYDAVTGKPL